MMINLKLKYSLVLLFYAFIICLSSCTSYKNIAYFEDLSDTARPSVAKTVPFKNPVIQTGDLLAITIQTIDNEVTALLNPANTYNGGVASMPVLGNSAATAPVPQTPNGYLVDKDGNVELPFAGNVHLAGFTTAEAREAVRKEVSKYFNNAVVNVRFANFKVTVIGEVARPSTFIVPNEKINIFDALGMAGDLTIYGRRENVLLLRDSLDNKQMVRINLNSKDIVSSPWFYLQPNDIIYIEPSKYKIASVDAVRNRNITIIASALSVMLVVATTIIK